MKEFSENEIYQIEEDFRRLAHKQYEDQKRLFYKLLLVALGLMAVGFCICLIFIK